MKKPKHIMAVQDTLGAKKMSIETPIGKLESDSGNHYLDILSIVLVIGVLYVGKKFVDKVMGIGDKFHYDN